MSSSPGAKPVAEGVVIDKWTREAVLGSGAFGIITLWRNTETNERMALKQCRWSVTGSPTVSPGTATISPQHRERWKQEVEIMHRLNHSNVVKALPVPPCLEKPSALNLPTLGMEYCSGGDLRKVLHRPEHCNGLSEARVRQILPQVSSALLYLHSNRIIHRDLKPENIVIKPLPDGTLSYKLIDLGYCKELDQSSLASSFVGTLQYLAPELFLSKQYSSAVDNWSFGLLAHEIITGRRPFLPHLSPAQWIPVVSKKKSEDICAYHDSKTNKVSFSKEISAFNHISSCFKSNLEVWLRSVLEWDPKKRGGKASFQQLIDDILKKSLVEVFVINSLQIFSYEVSNETKVFELKVLIESNCSINGKDQMLLFPPQAGDNSLMRILSDDSCDNQPLMKAFFSAGGGSGREMVIFVVDKKVPLVYTPYSTTCIIPPTVEDVLLSPTKLVTFEEQKNCWKHFLWVAQKLVGKYNDLVKASTYLLTYALRVNDRLLVKSSKVDVEVAVLVASTEQFKEEIKYSVDRLKNVSIQSTFAQNFLRKCEECLVAISSQEKLRDKHSTLSEDFKALSSAIKENVGHPGEGRFSFDPLQASETMYNHHNDDNTRIIEIYQNILRVYDEVRRKPKDERVKQAKIAGTIIAFDNTPMVKLLCDLFQLIEKLVKSVYLDITKLSDFVVPLNALNKDFDLLNNGVKEAQSKLKRLQLDQLNSLWQLFSAEDKGENANGNNTNPTNEVNLLVEKVEGMLSRLEMRKRRPSPSLLSREASPSLATNDRMSINSAASSPISSDWSFLP